MRFKCGDAVSATHVGDECLVIDGAAGACHILNETAGWLLSVSKEFIEIDDVIGEAEKRYQHPDPAEIARGIREAVVMLHDKGLLTVVEGD